MPTDIAYDEPFGWWGPVWVEPVPRTVPQLIRDDVLTADLAGCLWALLARRASVVVVAGPAGAGKTTLLTALLDLYPPRLRRVYVRGCYEPFAFFAESNPAATLLLVNEISAHLPIYLWGPGVRRVLAAARGEYTVAATAHATTVEELVASLTGYPLRVPPAEVAALEWVVHLDARREGGEVRREVREVAALRPTPAGGIDVARVARRLGGHGPLLLDWAAIHDVVRGSGEDPRVFAAETEERASVLADLSTAPPASLAATRAALAAAGARWASAGSRPRRPSSRTDA